LYFNRKGVAAAWDEKKYILCTGFPPAILRNYAHSVHSVHILDRCPQIYFGPRDDALFFNDLTSAKYSTCEGDFLALLHGASFSFAT
jgi:hypothetical protein